MLPSFRASILRCVLALFRVAPWWAVNHPRSARRLVAPLLAHAAASSGRAARRAWGEIRARYRLKHLMVPA